MIDPTFQLKKVFIILGRKTSAELMADSAWALSCIQNTSIFSYVRLLRFAFFVSSYALANSKPAVFKLHTIGAYPEYLFLSAKFQLVT